MRKDLKSMAMAMGKIRNPITKINDDTNYPEGPTQNLSNSKRISEKKFNRKLNRAKEGDVTQNQQDTYGFFGEKERGFSVKNTNVKTKNNVYIKRETPTSETNTKSYLKVKTKPTRKEKKENKENKKLNKENNIYNA